MKLFCLPVASPKKVDKVVVGTDGAWTGGAGDVFVLHNDFINESRRNQDWNTVKVELDFVAGAGNSHLMALPGLDLGAGRSGFANNFAWGILDISGQLLYLEDGNTDTSGGAFYVSELLGGRVVGDKIDNIFGKDGLKIY